MKQNRNKPKSRQEKRKSLPSRPLIMNTSTAASQEFPVTTFPVSICYWLDTGTEKRHEKKTSVLKRILRLHCNKRKLNACDDRDKQSDISEWVHAHEACRSFQRHRQTSLSVFFKVSLSSFAFLLDHFLSQVHSSALHSSESDHSWCLSLTRYSFTNESQAKLFSSLVQQSNSLRGWSWPFFSVRIRQRTTGRDVDHRLSGN